MTLYFAYGSNLDGEQMRQRCPSALLLGAATLPDHAIVFAGFSHRWDGAVASVMPRRGDRVQGLLYLLTLGDLRRLDHFEGCPISYRRRCQRVVEASGRIRTAAVYMKSPDVALALPSARYLEVIASAYALHGFAESRLQRAVRRSQRANAKNVNH